MVHAFNHGGVGQVKPGFKIHLSRMFEDGDYYDPPYAGEWDTHFGFFYRKEDSRDNAIYSWSWDRALIADLKAAYIAGIHLDYFVKTDYPFRRPPWQYSM